MLRNIRPPGDYSQQQFQPQMMRGIPNGAMNMNMKQVNQLQRAAMANSQQKYVIDYCLWCSKTLPSFIVNIMTVQSTGNADAATEGRESNATRPFRYGWEPSETILSGIDRQCALPVKASSTGWCPVQPQSRRHDAERPACARHAGPAAGRERSRFSTSTSPARHQPTIAES